MNTNDSKWLEDLSRWMDGELDTHDTEAFENGMESNATRIKTREVWEQIRAELRAGTCDRIDSTTVAADWTALESRLPPRQSEGKDHPAAADKNIIRFPWFWIGGFAAMAAAVALSIGVWIQDAGNNTAGDEAFAYSDSDASISFVETGIPGASSMMYVDEPSGWTIVWVTDPHQAGPSTSAS